MTAEAGNARLFLALWPPRATRDALVAHADAWPWPARARRTRTERLHVTLHFIGNVPRVRLDALRGGLAVETEPFALELDSPQLWPGGMAVLCPAETPPALARLHARLAQALSALQLPVEQRPYRPHVTLARKAFAARPPQSPAVAWPADGRYALVESLPGGRGYVDLAVYGAP